MPQGIPVSHCPGSNSHILLMSPEPSSEMISHMMIRKGVFLMRNFNTIFLTRNLMIIHFPI